MAKSSSLRMQKNNYEYKFIYPQCVSIAMHLPPPPSHLHVIDKAAPPACPARLPRPQPASLPNLSCDNLATYLLGVARLTRIGFLPIDTCCISNIARCCSASSVKRTKPYPLLRPKLSRTTKKDKKNKLFNNESTIPIIPWTTQIPAAFLHLVINL